MEERKISCSCWERFENACFRNVARYILFDVTLEIVQRNVSDIVHITLLSKSCMVQPLLQIRSLETLQLGGPTWFRHCSQTYRIQKFVLGFSIVDSLLLMEGVFLFLVVRC